MQQGGVRREAMSAGERGIEKITREERGYKGRVGGGVKIWVIQVSFQLSHATETQ